MELDEVSLTFQVDILDISWLKHQISFKFLFDSDPLYNGVDQWGALFGTYQDGSQSVEKDLYLRGLRQRRWGQSNPTTLHR